MDHSPMTPRAYLLAGFLFILLAMSGWSYAEESISATAEFDTAPTTTSYKAGWNGDYCAFAGQGSWQKTGEAACNEARAIANCGGLQGISYPGSGSACYRTGTGIVVAGLALSQTDCPAGYSKNAQNKCEKVTYSCPSNQGWTLVGSSCVRDSCAEGETRDENGVCQPPPPVCNHPDGTVLASGFYNVGTSSTGSPPPSACLDHCSTSFEGQGPYEVVISGVKNYFMQGAYYSGGSYCATNTPIVPGMSGLPSASCGSNQDMGTINGKTVCVNKSTGQPESTDAPKTTGTETTTTQNPDGSSTTTETTTHPDGTQTTTTTTTGTNGTKTTTVVTNGGQSELPQDGSATEATQKEILEELKKTHCEKNPDAAECTDSTLVDIIETDLLTEERSVSITPVSVGPAGSCPADRSYTLRNGQQIVFSWSAPCQFATGIRPVVLSIAWLSAALILIGAFRQES